MIEDSREYLAERAVVDGTSIRIDDGQADDAPNTAPGSAVEELLDALEPFARAGRALVRINEDKPGMALDPERGIFQTWGIKGSGKDATITVGDLLVALEVVEARRPRKDQTR